MSSLKPYEILYPEPMRFWGRVRVLKLLVVAMEVAMDCGGEARKALQYVQTLVADARDVVLITHEDCRASVLAHLPAVHVIFVQSPVGADVAASAVQFHRAAATVCQRFNPAAVVIHSLCARTPLGQRAVPQGYASVIGPLSPKQPEAAPDGRGARLRQRLKRGAAHGVRQVLGRSQDLFAGVGHVMIAGGAQTRDALRAAGLETARMVSVPGAGLPAPLLRLGRASPSRSRFDFLWVGQLLPGRGADLAIRALAMTPDPLTLTVLGRGPEQAQLRDLAQQLGVADRVRFGGWLPHDVLLRRMTFHRALVAPSLSASQALTAKEAMAVGLPVLTLHEGGAPDPAEADAALFVPAGQDEQVIWGVARAMIRLTCEPDLAERLSASAQRKARAELSWKQVAATWYAAAVRVYHQQQGLPAAE